MKQQLNKMETALIKAIVLENEKQYCFLKKHLDFLYVRSRENTRVGIYTNFGYYKNLENADVNVLISSTKSLRIEGLINEVTYVLDIKNGMFNFLEIVTNGNDFFTEDKFEYDFNIV